MVNRGISKTAILLFFILPGFVLLSGCSGEGGGMVGKDSIKYIARVEGNPQTLKTWIGNGAEADVLIHMDSSDEMKIFSRNLKESMKNAADHIRSGNANVVDRIAPLIREGGHVNLGYKGGLYQEVYWVIPTGVAPGERPLEDFKKTMMEKRGYNRELLSGLETEGKYITGELVGVPITITRLEDLDIGDKKAVLHIDLSYFSSRKSVDPGFQPGTGTLIKILRLLRDSRVYANFVTIDYSTTGQQTPIDIRFMGEMIYQALKNPSKLADPLPEKWTMMMEAEDSLVRGNYKEAREMYMKLSKLHPEDPGLAFSSAVASAFLKRGLESREMLLKAYGLDPMYLRGFFQLAHVMAVNGKVETGEILLETEQLARVISESELNYQKGVFYLNAGRFYNAITYLTRAARRGRRSFSLQSLLYTAYENTQDKEGMIGTLENMIEIDERRVIREMSWAYRRLGELYLEENRTDDAAEIYQRYLSVAPPDSVTPELEKKVRSLKK